ncbi:MAG TPA: hypothetical protein ENJ19_09505 [Gammaproteobacteria bacterium]|nr:hypothetical protein [Gammaproteobacteria bacterium]
MILQHWFAVAVAVGALLGPAWAVAGCGSANCFLVTGTQEGLAGVGQMTFDLSYRWIPMDQPQRGSAETSQALAPAVNFDTGEIEEDHHRELRTNNELVQLDVNYGFSERWGMALVLPLINNRRHEHVDIHHEPGDAEEESFSSQEYSGFGDVRLLGKYAFARTTRHVFVGGLGVKAPTGDYKLRNNAGGVINEPTVMPGTGSWDGLLSAYYAYQIRPRRWDWFVSGSYQHTTENDLGYRFGSTTLLNTGFNYRFQLQQRHYSAGLQLNLRHAPRDVFRGRDVSSTGGTWVHLTPGLRVQAGARTRLYVHLQLPVHQQVNDSNIVSRYGLVLGVSHSI